MNTVRFNGMDWDAAGAADWLATRLDRTIDDPKSDGNIMLTWDDKHKLGLMDRLKDVPSGDHRKIDHIFGEYARENGLLSDAFLREREARMNKELEFHYRDQPHRTFGQNVVAALRYVFS